MKIKNTSFLRFALFVVALVVFAACVFWLPSIANYFAETAPEFSYLKYPVLFGIYFTTIPFFFALYQAFKLLKYIDTNSSFSTLSVTALNNIKLCAIIIGVLYIIGIVFLDFQGAGQPGISLLGILITFASAVISVFAGILQELLMKAINIQKENELTI